MSRLFEAARRASERHLMAQPIDGIEAAIPDPDAVNLFQREDELRARVASPAPTVADDSAAAVRPAARSIVPERLLADDTWAAAFTEYRRMAATLAHVQHERGIRTLVVTSAVSGEGKSVTAANLAFTLGGLYRRRVLLVDGDMRCPALHTAFNVPRTPGLADCLRERRLLKSLPLQVRPGLHLLPAGQPVGEPGSHLITATARQFIGQIADQYDWVIVDTPPSALLPDAGLFAALVDAVVLVVQAGATKYDDVERVITEVGRDRIVGVVLNRMRPGSDPAHGYHEQADRYYGADGSD